MYLLLLTLMPASSAYPAAKLDLLDFYTAPQMQSFYMDHIRAIVSRVNTVNTM